jgi:hypothetical protein
MLDSLTSLGETPEEALDAYLESARGWQPADVRAEAEKDAILASASLIAYEGRVDGEDRYVARDREGVLAIYALGAWEGEGYVVSWYWVRLPEQVCEPVEP